MSAEREMFTEACADEQILFKEAKMICLVSYTPNFRW